MAKYNKPYYSNWRSMMSRCYRKKDASYKYYGGAGITVCDEWHSFDNFEKWALLAGYEKGLSIDRIDGSKGYSPLNCRWATKKEQANNRKSCVLISYEGETHNLSEWARIKGIPPKVLINRHWKGEKPPRLFERWLKIENNKSPFKGKSWRVDEEGKRKWVFGAKMDGGEDNA